jgi:hypothetical protein
MAITRSTLLACCLAGVLITGCADGPTPDAKPCDERCVDGIALRAVRETLKLVYNLKLQGKPVGVHDETTACPQGGTARVFGEASSNAVQGATEVRLTYEFEACKYLQVDAEPEENYRLTLAGSITQEGTIAVQPSATTALLMRSDAIVLSGTVNDPPIPLEEPSCAIEITQNGSSISGTFCGREAAFEF